MATVASSARMKMISSKLVATLLTAISGYTGYAIPGDLPHIEAVPHQVLEQRVCGRPCQVYAFTFPNGEIMIDEALAVGSDHVATSILVHELTHYLQLESVAHPRPVTCQEWNDREREAFEVQARWLRDTSVNVHVFSVEMSRLNFGAMYARCVDHSGLASQETWTKV
jgi:hypothetical protein